MKLWKVLGVAALVAGLTPYKTEHDIITDEKTCQALLWKMTNKPDEGEEGKRKISITFGFNNPLNKCCEDCCEAAEEPETCTEDLTVEASAEATADFSDEDVEPF